MPDLITTLGPFSGRTFTLLLALGAFLGTGALVLSAHKSRDRIRLIDGGLGALVGAAIGARLVHVLLNLDYFVDHGSEIFRLSAGGLDWHGAVLGGLLGLALVARWRHRKLAPLLDVLTPILPLIGMAAWYGCWAAGCGYGTEVDTLARYPAFTVSESRDVYGIIAPRYNAQLLGIGISAVVLIVALLLMRIERLRFLEGGFWIVLALLAAGMVAVGFIRGDYSPAFAGLRLDQWLDVGIVVLCIGVIAYRWLAISGQLSAFSERPDETRHQSSSGNPFNATA